MPGHYSSAISNHRICERLLLAQAQLQILRVAEDSCRILAGEDSGERGTRQAKPGDASATRMARSDDLGMPDHAFKFEDGCQSNQR